MQKNPAHDDSVSSALIDIISHSITRQGINNFHDNRLGRGILWQVYLDG